jgi:prepilin-type N-terminal cleavage/methylation domain-containing protein
MKTLIKSKNKKGFTLVELVIVIAVLAIIAAIAIPTVNNVIDSANKSADEANAQTIELALKTAHAEATTKTATGSLTNISVDELTVKDALEYNNILNSKSELPDCKQSDYHWYYTAGGKIVAAKSAPSSTYYQLQLSQKVTDVLSGNEPSKT